jgi:hypothetical protein
MKLNHGKILHQAGIMASRLGSSTALIINRAQVSTDIPFASSAICFPTLSPLAVIERLEIPVFMNPG